MALITPELLAILRCPATRSSLVQEEGYLVSTAAGSDGHRFKYSIEEGIPVLLRTEPQGAGDSVDPIPRKPQDDLRL